MATLPAADGRILSVGEITRAIKDVLFTSFPAVWVKGEISGFRGGHPSGHLYFTLKDASATLNCALYKSDAQKLNVPLRDGLEIEAFGSISVYEKGGSYQLAVRQVRLAGIGALLAKLEELKQRLAAAGLFDPARKRPLPRYPRTIGVVTSPVGAAVHDIVTVLQGRWPGIRIVLAPVKVQGEGAAQEIASAIARFDRWGGADLLIVGRGGGSIEDLWAFNEEIVVRAIAASRAPVISAVGHEIDTTLADLAADVRAATPSNAAELAVRDRREVRRIVETLRRRAHTRVRGRIDVLRHRFDAILRRHGFRRVHDLFDEKRQRIDELATRLGEQVRTRLAVSRERLQRARAAYGWRSSLPRRIAESRAGLARLGKRLDDAVVERVHEHRRYTVALADRLRALSPEKVLERGYSIVRDVQGSIVRSADSLHAGDHVTLRFANGGADAQVSAIRSRADTGGDDGRKE